MDSTLISAEEAESQFGITAPHHLMPNGERRFRLMGADGNGYIRTETLVGGWQQSHKHLHTFETYIVEAEWMAFAILNTKDEVEIIKYGPGASLTTPIGVCHNVYLPPGAITHTVKHGAQYTERDWWLCQTLNELTQHLSEAELMKMNFQV